MPEERFVLALPWVIPISLENVAAGALSTTVPSENVGPYNFVWTRLAIQTEETGGIFSVMIKDESESKNFMLNATRSNLLVPDDSHMVDLARPWVFKALSTIYVEATNEGAVQDSLYLALHGYLEM